MSAPHAQHAAPAYRFQALLERVVDGGFCIGCGACAAVPDSPLVMQLQADGLYRPQIRPGYTQADAGPDLGQVCPFYADDDEDTLASVRYADAPARNAALGFYRQCYAGSVTDPESRAVSSSGGLVTWVLDALLQRGWVDGVIHVGAVEGDPEGALFRYQVARRPGEASRGAKTRYYPVEFSRVAGFIRAHPGRYAFVGVPCFVKAIRLLAKNDPAIDAAITYTIALFCGHMKSAAYAEHLAWQLGVPPGALDGIDFRSKRAGVPANRYGVTVRAKDANGGERVERFAPMEQLHGGDWGLGLFKPRACDFCDDVAGETADLACGDAWLPEYVSDSRGTSVLIVRDAALERLLMDGCREGEVDLERLAPERVAASQDASYRHRGEGLAYRLAQWDQAGRWRPRKRVLPRHDGLSPRQQRVVDLRVVLAERSHGAFMRARHKGRHWVFRARMAPWILRYTVCHRGLLRACAQPLRRLWRRMGRS
ncbi:Coenzyme F420 hydrogenase/dehydrogenase, beta subunit C-terminal domain [Spiribacter salinus]|uniref:Coenzyme F420 hydrogenase/dehydrogenase, beta subunit C-terminal domain n=1 Tax=Spiribacter salinus TaxID=1335746 RepID=UPI001C9698FF|nr:Coenzyme F420 hydrogenase/dehydrogenase, beta subunit C-terminal domain [Spiribacter salinus]